MKPRDVLVFALLVLLLAAAGFAADQSSLVCVGAKMYPSPTDPPLENGVLILNDGKIAVVASQGRVKYDLPRSAVRLDCSGKVVVAGFWNSHVHFENGWHGAASAPATQLEAHMQEMLTRWGFATVWDLGSE